MSKSAGFLGAVRAEVRSVFPRAVSSNEVVVRARSDGESNPKSEVLSASGCVAHAAGEATQTERGFSSCALNTEGFSAFSLLYQLIKGKRLHLSINAILPSINKPPAPSSVVLSSRLGRLLRSSFQ